MLCDQAIIVIQWMERNRKIKGENKGTGSFSVENDDKPVVPKLEIDKTNKSILEYCQSPIFMVKGIFDGFWKSS